VLLYATLFLALFYFKVFRVRRKQEQRSFLTQVEDAVSNSALFALVIFGFLSEPWYMMLFALVIMSVIASLIVTAVQLGFFIDGKPVFGISKLYALMPLLSVMVTAGSVGTIVINYLG